MQFHLWFSNSYVLPNNGVCALAFAQGPLQLDADPFSNLSHGMHNDASNACHAAGLKTHINEAIASECASWSTCQHRLRMACLPSSVSNNTKCTEDA